MRIYFYALPKECKCKWFGFRRYWSEKIWNISFKRYTLSLDFRKNWLKDMIPKSKDNNG
jgi:hypothetical protein